MTNSAGLEPRAKEFAEELESLFTAVLGSATAPEFKIEAATHRSGSQRFVVEPNPARIQLSINGEPALTLGCYFHCEWDGRGEHLKVRKSGFTVSPIGERAAPLVRYEYEDSMSRAFPSAHLQIHAHRDEFLFAMLRGDRSKPRSRRQAALGEAPKAAPHLSNLHFALGGPRFRPCVEDILQLLLVEFGIDTVHGAQDALNRGRIAWRRQQLAAAVRDDPATAAHVLREMGYSAAPPPTGHPEANTTGLGRI